MTIIITMLFLSDYKDNKDLIVYAQRYVKVLVYHLYYKTLKVDKIS